MRSAAARLTSWASRTAGWMGLLTGGLLLGWARAEPPIMLPPPRVVTAPATLPAARPQAAQPPELSPIPLTAALALALDQNPRLRRAAAAVDQAQALEEAAFAPFLPEVGLLTRAGLTTGNLSPGAPGPTGAIIGLRDTRHLFTQAELDLQWMLYDFGRTQGRHREAIARTRVASLKLVRARQAVALDVCAAYLRGLQASTVITTQLEAIRRAESALHDAKARRRAGVVETNDVLRAEVQLADARDAYVVSIQQQQAALAELNHVLGRDASLPVRLQYLPERAAFTTSLEECLHAALGGRPEVSIARETILAAHAGRDVAAADLCPRVYLRGSLGQVEGDNIRTGNQQGAAIHIDMPLYAGGRFRAALRAADAVVQEAVASARGIFDTITLEVTLAHQEVTAAQRRVELARPAVEQGRENLRRLTSRYRNGDATPTDLVDAEAALTRTEQRLVATRYEYLLALARLEFAVGGAPSSFLGETVPAVSPTPAPRPVP
ncbi:MAG: TolC family protein [Gemmataceae bacterium]